MEKKILDKNFFTTIWSNWQAESSTDIWTDKISSKWHTKVAQCPMMKKKELYPKKTSSKNLLGYVVSKCDKFADCFFDKKNRYFSVQFRKNMKKNKQHLCQNNVLSSNFSSWHVESSFVKLNERFSEKNRQIFAECP